MSIKIWYGCKFKEAKGGISYVGGFGRIMEVDPYDLSMDYLMSLANKCNGDRGIQELFLLASRLHFKGWLKEDRWGKCCCWVT